MPLWMRCEYNGRTSKTPAQGLGSLHTSYTLIFNSQRMAWRPQARTEKGERDMAVLQVPRITRPNIFYRWWIVLAGTVIMSLMDAFSYYGMGQVIRQDLEFL